MSYSKHEYINQLSTRRTLLFTSLLETSSFHFFRFWTGFNRNTIHAAFSLTDSGICLAGYLIIYKPTSRKPFLLSGIRGVWGVHIHFVNLFILLRGCC